jgi:AhpD family alkylhydroperoxidase
MSPRINFAKASPDAYKAVYNLDRYVVKESGLEPAIIHLIKLRASIINGCAYCVDMHVKESRHDGLSEQWINLVSVWHEATLYTPRERALLAWVDAVTLIAQTRAPDDVYDELRKHFSDDECVKITTAIGAINVWNRLAVAFRAPHPIDAKAAA